MKVREIVANYLNLESFGLMLETLRRPCHDFTNRRGHSRL